MKGKKLDKDDRIVLILKALRKKCGGECRRIRIFNHATKMGYDCKIAQFYLDIQGMAKLGLLEETDKQKVRIKG